MAVVFFALAALAFWAGPVRLIQLQKDVHEAQKKVEADNVLENLQKVMEEVKARDPALAHKNANGVPKSEEKGPVLRGRWPSYQDLVPLPEPSNKWTLQVKQEKRDEFSRSPLFLGSSAGTLVLVGLGLVVLTGKRKESPACEA